MTDFYIINARGDRAQDVVPANLLAWLEAHNIKASEVRTMGVETLGGGIALISITMLVELPSAH